MVGDTKKTTIFSTTCKIPDILVAFECSNENVLMRAAEHLDYISRDLFGWAAFYPF